VADNFNSIKGIVDHYGKNNALFQKYTGPGGFFDPDMVLALLNFLMFFFIHLIVLFCFLYYFKQKKMKKLEIM